VSDGERMHEAAEIAAEMWRCRKTDRSRRRRRPCGCRAHGTPGIYNFELNVDPALEGGSGARVTPSQRTALIAHRDAAERLVLEQARAARPAAFVFFDKAPFGHPDDAELDFATHCPDLHRWVEENYEPATAFGTVRVRLLRR
jgi:hypothetical protein